jgi:septum formation topological specificity factor MinE
MGRVMFEWNALHTALFRTFVLLLGDAGDGTAPPGSPGSLATELWTTAPSDAAQRKLLLIVAKDRQAKNPMLFQKIKWLIGIMEVLSEYRNIAAHLAIEFNESGTHLGPARFVVRQTAVVKQVIVEYKHQNLWDHLANDLYLLSQYTWYINYNMVMPSISPLPYKPRLLSPPMLKWANDIIHRALPVRKRRRRASRAKS